MRPAVASIVEAALATAPATKFKIAEAHGLNVNSVNTAIERLRSAGRAYISGWKSGEGHSIAIFSLGSGEDAPRPPAKQPGPRAPKKKARKVTPGGAIRAKIVELLMEHKRLTMPEIVEMTGLDRRSVYSEVKALRNDKKARICDYVEHGRQGWPIAVIALGIRPDAARPRMTKAESSRKYRENKKAIIRARRKIREKFKPRAPVWLIGLLP